MSYYLALFGPSVDLGQLGAIHPLEECKVSDVGRRAMSELVRVHRLVHPRFIVDETGDTAHELVSEAWSGEGGIAALGGTRFGELLQRAEAAGAAVAVWDASSEDPSSWSGPVARGYAAFRDHLMECESVWDIDGLLCVPDEDAAGSRNVRA